MLLFSISHQAQQLIHYWHFNTANGTFDSIAADVFASPSAPYIIYQAAFPNVIGGGYMDDVSGTTTNTRNNEPAGNGIRPRNPSDSMELVIQLPSSGFENLMLSYAVQRSGSGMLQQVLYYTTDGVSFTSLPDTITINTSWDSVTIDLSNITGVENNPDFAIKIRFVGQNTASNGNNRIDNLALEGSSITGGLIHYWHFNLVNGTVDSVAADVYAGADAPHIYYQPSFPDVTGGGFMDDVSGDITNARNNEPAGTGIRPRNPSDSMELFVQLPSNGFEALEISYASQRSGSGMLQQVLYYTTDGVSYTPHPDTVNVQTAWTLVSFDFSAISAANNNPDFAVKIRFFGQNTASNGNNRIDNFVLEGNSLGGAVTGVTITPKSINLLVGGNAMLNGTVVPASATNQSVTWSSTDASVVTVNSAGEISATGLGVADVIVTTVDGGFSDTCEVTVLNPANLTVNVLGEGSPLPGAAVIVNNDTLITDGLGVATIQLMPGENYLIVAEANGYFPENVSANINGDTTIVLDLNEMNAIVHYWHFNNLPIGTVTSVDADYTLTPWNHPVITYEGNSSGYMDDYTPGSALNAQLGESEGAALRVRNRSEGRALIIPLPTDQCQDIVLSFDIHRSGQGMLTNHFEYTLDGLNYDTVGIVPSTISVTETYTTHVIDFSAVAGANNNPNFGVRITWTGNTEQDNGNNRYDNIVMNANTTLSTKDFENNTSQVLVYPNPGNGTFTLMNAQSGANCKVIDMVGNVVLETKLDSDNSTFHFPENLQNGMYLLVLEKNGNTQVQRVILQK